MLCWLERASALLDIWGGNDKIKKLSNRMKMCKAKTSEIKMSPSMGQPLEEWDFRGQKAAEGNHDPISTKGGSSHGTFLQPFATLGAKQ